MFVNNANGQKGLSFRPTSAKLMHMYSALDFEQTFIIEGQILGYCGPLFFSRSSDLVPMNVVSNASFGLVDTGQRSLLVTCSHVVEAFDAERTQNHDFQMAILLGGGYPVALDRSQLIDSDPHLALATFDMGASFKHCSKRKFYPVQRNPPPAIKPHDILAFVGYTGEARSVAPVGANFGYQSFGLSVADVSGFRLVADITNTERVADPDGTPLPPADSLGGISGAPIFQYTSKALLLLVAFATEEGLGLVRMTHANRIRPDGTLIRDT